MNIHINKNTRFQSWGGKTIFNEYPVHIRSGNFTVTLMFHDFDSMDSLRQILTETMYEVKPDGFLDPFITTNPTKSKRF